VAWTNSVCPCHLVINKDTKVAGVVVVHCPHVGGGRGVERYKWKSWQVCNSNFLSAGISRAVYLVHDVVPYVWWCG